MRHFLVQALGRAQGLAGVVQEYLVGGGGGPHLAGATFEQTRVEGLFDLGDLVAECRLHGVAAACGRGEATFFGHGHGQFQLAQGRHAISQDDGCGEDNALERCRPAAHTAHIP
ncbi:hypothetical protein ADT26_11120 [Xanthomonas oryzae]|nr:hypothetical protein AXO1947_18190 [Xanthomonas oryzae pv. oryzae]KOR43880.1 hypothetical protein ADT26_11120 [Xanthomonas oryzae]